MPFVDDCRSQERKLAEAQRVIERQADEIAELTFMRDESSRRASSLEVEQGELRALLEERERMHKAEVERLQVSAKCSCVAGLAAGAWRWGTAGGRG